MTWETKHDTHELQQHQSRIMTDQQRDNVANALRMIRRADLLEAAKEMHSVASLHALECLGNSHAARFMEAINDLEAAIAKAEGKL